MTNSNSEATGPGRTLDDVPPTTTDYNTITKPAPTASPDTTPKMPETAASRRAQVVPLLGGHDGHDDSSSSSNRPSHSHQTSIDSLTPLTPGVVGPSYHATTTTSSSGPFPEEEEDLTTGKFALRSWLTVLGAWLAIFSSFGLLTVLSICQSYLSGNGDVNEKVASISEGTFAWVFSLYFVVSLGLGLYVGPLSDRYGARYLVLTGTVFLGVGMVVLAVRSGEFSFFFRFWWMDGWGIEGEREREKGEIGSTKEEGDQIQELV